MTKPLRLTIENERTSVRIPLISGPVPASWSSTETGEPFGVIGSDILERHGYIEEEFFVSGFGNVYCYDQAWSLQVQRRDLPFTTRILVRRPASPQKFSGNVIVEPLAIPGDFSIIFDQCCDFFLPNGDVWIGVTIGPFSAQFPRAFDPRRYGPLNLIDEGQIFDILCQVGTALKQPDTGSLLSGFDIRRTYLTGSSHLGLLLLTYLSDGFHERNRLTQDRPIYDGYLVSVAHGSAGRYRICSPPQGVRNWHLDMLAHPSEEFPYDDPRRRVGPHDVPVIEIAAESDVLLAASPPSPRDCPMPYAHDWPATLEARLFYRRDDSDAAADRFRLYELAGCPHKPPPDAIEASAGAKRQLSKAQLTAFGLTGFDGRLTLGTARPISDYPLRYWLCGAWANLQTWVNRGIAPPRAARIEIDPATMTIVRDEHGNAKGGVRSPYIDVPIATYIGTNTRAPGPLTYFPGTMGIRGAKLAFSGTKLSQMYGTHEKYMVQLKRRMDELANDRWLLPVHAELIRKEALQAKELFDAAARLSDP